MPIERLRPTFTLTEDRLEQLRAVVPEAFAEGRIDWDTLRQLLAEHLEDEEEPTERFGLFWPGKREARRAAAMPSEGTLVPCPGEGVDEENTRNIFIEGENLEVLRLLRKAYAGKLKMIYIDPPYNTGNDFVYSDDYTEPVETYLRRTGQVGEGGELLTSNPKTSGRYHSNWLNMMYPRLVLARDLLREDGALFVSIDEHEVHNLRELLDEVFGGTNFVAQITVLTNPKGRVMQEHFAQCHDYILAYAKSAADVDLSIAKSEEEVATEYRETDSHGRFRFLELRNTHRQFGRHNRRNLWYPLFVDTADGTVSTVAGEGWVELLPYWGDGYEGCWTWSRKKAEVSRHLLLARQVGEQWKVFRKSYAVTEGGEPVRKKLKTIWTEKGFQTSRGQTEFDDLVPGRVFQSPKPVSLLSTLVGVSSAADDIVADFFAGSCTTAHAVLDLNRRDGSNRRFLMVQLPEAVQSGTSAGRNALQHGFATVADIGKERIRRVSGMLCGEKDGQLQRAQRDGPEDLGFRVFRLDHSNFRQWRDYEGNSTTELQNLFERFQSPLVDGWRCEDLLVEVMLEEGFPLDSRIIRQSGLAQNAVDVVESDGCQHRLWICLDARLADATISQLQLAAEDVLVCLDSALTDEQKMRLNDSWQVKVI